MSDVLTWADATRKRENERFKELVTVAYMLACWHHTDPKKIPNLTDVLKSFDEKKPQSAQDMLQVIKMLNARFGGSGG